MQNAGAESSLEKTTSAGLIGALEAQVSLVNPNTVLDGQPCHLRLHNTNPSSSSPYQLVTVDGGGTKSGEHTSQDSSDSELDADKVTLKLDPSLSPELSFLSITSISEVSEQTRNPESATRRFLVGLAAAHSSLGDSRLSWLPMKFTDQEVERRYQEVWDEQFRCISKYGLLIWYTVGLILVSGEVVHHRLLNTTFSRLSLVKIAVRILQLSIMLSALIPIGCCRSRQSASNAAPTKSTGAMRPARRYVLCLLAINLVFEWVHTILTFSVIGGSPEADGRDTKDQVLPVAMQRSRMLALAAKLSLEYVGDAWTELYALMLVNVFLGVQQRTALNFNSIFWILHIKYTIYSLASAADRSGLALGTTTEDSHRRLVRHQSLPISLLLGRAMVAAMFCIAQFVGEVNDRVRYLERRDAIATVTAYNECHNWQDEHTNQKLTEEYSADCAVGKILGHLISVRKILLHTVKRRKYRLKLEAALTTIAVAEQTIYRNISHMHSIKFAALSRSEQLWAAALIQKTFLITPTKRTPSASAIGGFPRHPATGQLSRSVSSTFSSLMNEFVGDTAATQAFGELGVMLDMLTDTARPHIIRKTRAIFRILQKFGILSSLQVHEKIGAILVTFLSRLFSQGYEEPSNHLAFLYNSSAVEDGLRVFVANELLRLTVGRESLREPWFRELMTFVADSLYYTAWICAMEVRRRFLKFDARKNAHDRRLLLTALVKFIQLRRDQEDHLFATNPRQDLAHLLTSARSLMVGGDDHSSSGGKPLFLSDASRDHSPRRILCALMQANTAEEFKARWARERSDLLDAHSRSS